MNKVILKPKREHSLLRRHPWVFSGAVEKTEGEHQPGATVDVFSRNGQFLGRGAWSPVSQIRVRIWSFDEKETIDDSFFKKKITQAIKLRNDLQIPAGTNALRLVAAEADDLPGVIIDRYDNFLVCQFLSSGAEFWKNTIVEQLKSLTGIPNIYERSDVDVRRKEGLKPVQGVLNGERPPDLIEISENGLRFYIDIKKGHKTGFYLDQRDNRQLVRAFSSERDVLNCFSYSGGFGVTALNAGAAHVTNVEDNENLVGLTSQNFELNNLDENRYSNIKADVFKQLREYLQTKKTFDLIVLDPPKFAGSQSQLKGASRGYKDINLLAFKLLRPGGILFTFSCSGLMKPELFQKIVADAAIDSGRNIQILRWLTQSSDHPVKLHIPESYYLKGLILQLQD